MADRDGENRERHVRILCVGSLFAFFYLAVLFRSYNLQILGNNRLNNLVKSQYKTSVVIQPRRGAIYDRNGEVLAMDVMVASIGIHPHLISDKMAAGALISKHVSLAAKDVATKLASDKKFLWIERRIPIEDGNAIAAAKIPGIDVVHEFRRYYPNKQLAGQVLGAVGYDAKALGGLEMSYDHYLKTESQLTQAERDARGKLFTLMNDPDANNDIYLTIDKNIQHFTEEALAENAVKHAAKNGFAIVTDVRTGEILAMANWPEFNPNDYWQYAQDDWKNHAVIDTFEPGSTFKAVLMGAALASGKVKPSDKFNCEGGRLRIGTNTINDHGGYGMMTAQQILQVSSNIGVTKIAFKIGRESFRDFVTELGFGRRVGIGLAGEAGGFFRANEKNWREIEFSNMAFGQGISVTGLQMVSSYGAFANGGIKMKPYLVGRIMNSDGGEIFKQSPIAEERVMPEQASRELSAMLFTVTQPGGTATTAAVEGYLAAGKTGTAQKVDPKIKTYAKGQFVSSFIGFAPLDQPRLAIYVVYDTPRKNGYYGGVAAAPMFKKIAQASLAYLGVPPSDVNSPVVKMGTAFLPPKVVPKPKPKAEVVLAKKAPRDWDAIKEALALHKMPDLRGLGLRSLLNLSRQNGASLEVEGEGFVVAQLPKADGELSGTWKLKLAPQGWGRVEPQEDKAAAKLKTNTRQKKRR